MLTKCCLQISTHSNIVSIKLLFIFGVEYYHDLSSANASSDHDVGQLQQVQDVPLVIVTGTASTGAGGRHPLVHVPGPVDVVLAAATAGHLPNVLYH